MRFYPLLLALALLPATAHAQQQCGGDFDAWKAAVEKQAASEGIGERGLAALDKAEVNMNVIASDRT